MQTVLKFSLTPPPPPTSRSLLWIPPSSSSSTAPLSLLPLFLLLYCPSFLPLFFSSTLLPPTI